MEFDIEYVKEAIRIVTGCDVSENTRKREFVDARLIYFNILRDNTELSASKIGKTLNKDHSTVLHNWSRFQDMIQTSAEFRKKYETILDFLSEEKQDEYDTEELLKSNSDLRVENLKLRDCISKLETQLKNAKEEFRTYKSKMIQPKNQQATVYHCTEGISNLIY
jgi:regulator of replication initiation timing